MLSVVVPRQQDRNGKKVWENIERKSGRKSLNIIREWWREIKTGSALWEVGCEV